MLRKLAGYFGKFYSQSYYDHSAKPISWKDITTAISSDPDIDFSVFVKEDVGKIKAEIADLMADGAINPEIRNYVVGFALLCLPEETPAMQDVINKYLTTTRNAAEILNEILFQKSIDARLTPLIRQAASQLLTRCAVRGDSIAVDKVIAKIRFQHEDRPELLYGLSCLKVLNLAKKTERQIELYYLYQFFLKDNFVTKSPDIDEAVYWIGIFPGLYIYRDDRWDKVIQSPNYLLDQHHSLFAYKLLADDYSWSLELKRKVWRTQLEKRISQMDIPSGRKQAYLTYIDSLKGVIAHYNPEKQKKAADMILTYGENFLAALVYFRAAKYSFSLTNATKRHNAFNYLKSACEALTFDRPSHYHLLRDILRKLEKLIPFEPNAKSLYVTFKEKYEKKIQEFISLIKNAELRERTQELGATEQKLSSTMQITQKIIETQEVKMIPTEPKIEKCELKEDSAIHFENEKAAKSLFKITQLLEEKHMKDSDYQPIFASKPT